MNLDGVLKYTGKTADELLVDIKGTNLGDYLNGTTVSDILKKYNLKDIQDVWKLPGTKRGQVIEELLPHSEYSDWWNCGAEFGGYYPTIDFALVMML